MQRTNLIEAAVLQPVRFGEFLRDQNLITDEQWLAALAAHWSERRGPIGLTIASAGYLAWSEVERHARAFHDLDVIEVDAPVCVSRAAIP